MKDPISKKDPISTATNAIHGNADAPPQQDASSLLDTNALYCICQHRFESLDALTEMVASLYKAFHGQASTSPTFHENFKRRLRQLLSLPRQAGRRPDERVTEAAKLRSQRVPWNTILLKVIPGYAGLDAASRIVERIKLQHAVHARLKGKNDRGCF